MRLWRALPTLIVASAMALSGASSLAANREIQGRTGLPVVRLGSGKIWLERGAVALRTMGGNVLADERFRMHYPGPPLERRRLVSTIAVREEYYRSTAAGAPKVTPADASGFNRFYVW